MTSRSRTASNPITGGAVATPLVVLFGLNFVDELDQILFGIVTPEIRDDLGLTDGGIIFISALVSVFVLFAVMPLTYLADRFNRVRLVFFAALGWMSMSILTGLSGWAGLVFLLVIARMGSGLGRTVNDPVHASLLTDYYEPAVQPRVFEFHRAANPVSRVTAVLIGFGAGRPRLAGDVPGPRRPHGLPDRRRAARLPEPRRVHHQGRPTPTLETAVLDDDGRRTSRRRCRSSRPARTLFAIPSMRRLYVGVVPARLRLPHPRQRSSSLFFEDIYGFSPTMRGVAAFLAGAGTLVGLQLRPAPGEQGASPPDAPNGSPPSPAWRSPPAPSASILMAITPFAAGSLLFSVLASAGFSAFTAGVLPARRADHAGPDPDAGLRLVAHPRRLRRLRRRHRRRRSGRVVVPHRHRGPVGHRRHRRSGRRLGGQVRRPRRRAGARSRL